MIHRGNECKQNSITGLQHLRDNAHQSPILQRSSNPLLVAQLLIDLFTGTMRALFDANIDTEPRGKRLLQPHPHAQSDDSRQAAVGDCGCDQDGDGAERRGGLVW